VTLDLDEILPGPPHPGRSLIKLFSIKTFIHNCLHNTEKCATLDNPSDEPAPRVPLRERQDTPSQCCYPSCRTAPVRNASGGDEGEAAGVGFRAQLFAPMYTMSGPSPSPALAWPLIDGQAGIKADCAICP